MISVQDRWPVTKKRKKRGRAVAPGFTMMRGKKDEGERGGGPGGCGHGHYSRLTLLRLRKEGKGGGGTARNRPMP